LGGEIEKARGEDMVWGVRCESEGKSKSEGERIISLNGLGKII
jgi:hypothetical protein